MLEWIASSSVLILAVAVLRRALRGRISPRLQYALWLIVLLRLLVPLNIGQAKVSVQNVVREADTKIASQVVTYVNYELPDLAVPEPDPAQPEAEREAQYEQNAAEYEAQIEAAKAETGTPVTLSDILRYVWYGGMAAMALWFIVTNLMFRARLRRGRQRIDYACALPVYVTGAVETPCLFGSAIYVTREAAADALTLRHSVEHELTHRRHGDHVWALLRCACLVLHWYNPLVWLAAMLSRRDAELACDEATIRRLGEDERAAYGRTLIGIACEKRATLLRTATTMNCGRAGLKERILLIAKKPKTAVYAVVILILVAVAAMGCSFTGAQETEPGPSSTEDFTAAGTGLEAGEGGHLAESYEKYREAIEARAQENVDRAVKSDGSPAFTGYEVTRFELADSFGGDGGKYEVYAWDAAYIPDGDVTLVPLAGGMYVDAEGRVAGYEQDTYLAALNHSDGSFDVRFLTGELFLGPNEALGLESARCYVRAAFTERGWLPAMLCMAADEVLEGLGELPEYGPSEEEYAWKLLLMARVPLYDFKFVRLEPSYEGFTVTETYFETAELTPNTPVVLWATFPGDAPQFGLSFRDGSGEEWQLKIYANWASDEGGVLLIGRS